MNTPKTKPGGWFAISRADMETILDSAGERDGATMMLVWLALLSFCNVQKTAELTIHISKIARVCALSYKATARNLKKLATTNLLEIQPRMSADNRSHEASIYRIKASVSPWVQTTQPLGTNDPTLGYSSSRRSAETNINNKTKETILNKRECADALTPHNFKELAKKANDNRLSGSELESFCDYWLEKNSKGKCRFQLQSCFEITKRIATWQRRMNDFSTGKQSGDEDACKEIQRRKNELAGQLLKEIYES